MKNITSGTIARTIVLALALINQLLTTMGIAVIPIENEQIEMLCSTIFTIGAALVAWWKNNSFTQKAIEADKVLKENKNGD